MEGLPVALLEAIASGKPVIASQDTNITFLDEWSEIAEAVELLEDPSDTDAFADAVERILSLEPNVIAHNSRILRRVADRYRWKNLIREYLMIIDKAQG